ncbi:uncharacterized protein SPSK_09882 [Sporothrix schenckii 1099-18]|uniref:Uncharacterized protein n=1 Tax=Sporothrix schenckii 1099-18 TaxID=1397361 RepID=A0A0F2MA68_SPOSC|nr:uncharacterized protein SPSK_09882 [Sporothrix schenckii 1099-18]KJR85056.1 hypothetical protein SPSK_09882 [Sporothrix schenckii 1099-18]
MRPRMALKSVPTIAQVVPGAYVNIVLKQDQPTGRTVQGMVQNVLTRGNHPRGIKVRLSDGRVGRVQTMAGAGGSGDGGHSGASMVTAPAYGAAASAFGASAFGASGFDTTAAAAGVDGAPREQICLDAYVRPAKKQHKRRGGNRAGTADADSPTTAATAAATAPAVATTKCPVCNDFEGDEAAVSHHVSSHFD